MPCPARLLPDHRAEFQLPRAWPACAQAPLRAGAAWLHAGMAGGWGLDLLAPPGGEVLASRWTGNRWRTTFAGMEAEGSPFEILERVASASDAPLLGALSFELACHEAGLPHQPPREGALGLFWRTAPELLAVSGQGAEIWSWGAPAVPEPWEARLGMACALGQGRLGPLAPRWDEARHRAEVELIQSTIRDGGFYVANLCVPFDGALAGDAVTFALAALRRARPPFGAWLDLGGETLLCLSMERALSLASGRLRCEPIKGTVPHLGDGASDEAAAARLRTDPKERAEHVMILDLVRNDLGRVARTGSVEVVEALAVRPFGSVQHMVSAVEADLAPGTGLAAILRATLPGGSVTGAPKHAVCAHLARTEAAPRGFYCGALGWIGPGGTTFDLAMPIRTAQLRGEAVTYWAGGGITRLSDPAEEWKEVWLKARAIQP
ncbi:MAG: anthranilate synthase component I family protein [Holophagaceae bacterium]|nr:anthranilate synthase component I family protein [Holophagaceae bacterium]